MEHEALRHRWHKRAPKVALIVVVALAAFGWIVMSLWNWLLPTLFGLPRIGFWQALGVLILSKILFGGLRGGPWHHPHWRARLLARWEQMTPEERERLRDALRGCHG